MESKKKSYKGFPSLTFWYGKLYFERRGSKKPKFYNNMQESMKTWNSLNKSEKQYFTIKYEECKRKYNEKFVTCLQKAEPFMKEKVIRGKSNSNTMVTNEDHNGQDTLEENELTLVEKPGNELPLTIEDEQLENIEYGSNSPNNKECEQNTEQDNRNLIETMEVQDSRLLYTEPTPPTLKTGKQLFEMLQSMGQKKDSEWKSLPEIERSRYNRAVLTIKKDYLRNYRMYLENLSARDLFAHYNKIF